MGLQGNTGCARIRQLCPLSFAVFSVLTYASRFLDSILLRLINVSCLRILARRRARFVLLRLLVINMGLNHGLSIPSLLGVRNPLASEDLGSWTLEANLLN